MNKIKFLLALWDCFEVAAVTAYATVTAYMSSNNGSQLFTGKQEEMLLFWGGVSVAVIKALDATIVKLCKEYMGQPDKLDSKDNLSPTITTQPPLNKV